MALEELTLLREKLAETRDGFIRALASGGGVGDYSAYKELCGKINGLLIALQEIDDLTAMMKRNENG
jgi:hypothetical protein